MLSNITDTPEVVDNTIVRTEELVCYIPLTVGNVRHAFPV